MLSLRKLLIVFLLCSPAALAQNIVLQNFNNGTGGATVTASVLNAATFGTLGTSPAPFNTYLGTSGVLTYGAPTGPCATLPPGVTSTLALQYNTTAANAVGTGNQLIQFADGFSGMPAATSNTDQQVTWFCTDLQDGEKLESCDCFTLLGSGSGGVSDNATNVIFEADGTNMWFTLESGNCAGPCGNIRYVQNSGWVGIPSQYAVDGTGACSITNLAKCVVFQIRDTNGTLLTACNTGTSCSPTQYGDGPSGPLTEELIGNGQPCNSSICTGGRHIWFMNWKQSYLGSVPQQFPMLNNPVVPWDGIISANRAADWRLAGISQAANQGTLPDASWTQCGSTVAAGTSSATIQSLATACGGTPNQYLLLGPGAFTATARVVSPATGNFVIRGSGSNSTFVTVTGGSVCPGQTSAPFCIASSDGTFTTQPPANTCTISAGLTQGSTSITIANLAGTCLSGIVPNKTILWLDACDSGTSGTSCLTGSATDNGNAYICGAIYNSAGPNGCSFDGPDAGGSRTGRNQLEPHIASAVNTGTGVVTLTTPIASPNFASASNPQVWIVQPVVNEGIEDMSIDLSNAGATQGCVDIVSGLNVWIKGVRCLHNKRDAFNVFQTAYSNIQSNYIFDSTGTLPSNYGIRLSADGYMVTQNNIIQQIQGGALFYDGACTMCVDGFNFPAKSETGGDLTPITEHAGGYMNLHEGSYLSISCDNTHATCDWSTRFRNFLTGWTSDPTTPLGTFTNGVADFAFARNINNAGNVLGTKGYHTTYTSVSSGLSIYNAGTGGGGPSVPTDTLTKSTSMYWASYDVVTAAANSGNGLLFCGNLLNTNFAAAGFCNSISQVPASASVYPNYVPVVGDTAAGQAPLPNSFYLTGKPIWFGSLPWPLIGPDVTGGNIGQCTGTPNTPGQMAGMPATTNGQCPGTTLAVGWGGHANTSPAQNCYLNTMGGPADGSGGALAFDANACFAASGGSVTLAPSPENFGSINTGSSSSPVTFTLTNGSGTTATSITPSVSGGNSGDFSITNSGAGSCGAAGGSIAAAASCTFTVTFTPGAVGARSTSLSVSYSGGDSASPQTSALSGTGTTPGTITTPGCALCLFAGLEILNGQVIIQ